MSGPDGRLPVKLRHGIRAELWHPSFLLADIPLSVDEHPPWTPSPLRQRAFAGRGAAPSPE